MCCLLLSLQLIYQVSNIKTHRTFNQLALCVLCGFSFYFWWKLTISFTFHFRFSSFIFYTFFLCVFFHSFLRLFHSKLFDCIVMECMNNHLIICNALMLVLFIFFSQMPWSFFFAIAASDNSNYIRRARWNEIITRKKCGCVYIL